MLCKGLNEKIFQNEVSEETKEIEACSSFRNFHKNYSALFSLLGSLDRKAVEVCYFVLGHRITEGMGTILPDNFDKRCNQFRDRQLQCEAAIQKNIYKELYLHHQKRKTAPHLYQFDLSAFLDSNYAMIERLYKLLDHVSKKIMGFSPVPDQGFVSYLEQHKWYNIMQHMLLVYGNDIKPLKRSTLIQARKNVRLLFTNLMTHYTTFVEQCFAFSRSKNAVPEQSILHPSVLLVTLAEVTDGRAVLNNIFDLCDKYLTIKEKISSLCPSRHLYVEGLPVDRVQNDHKTDQEMVLQDVMVEGGIVNGEIHNKETDQASNNSLDLDKSICLVSSKLLDDNFPVIQTSENIPSIRENDLALVIKDFIDGKNVSRSPEKLLDGEILETDKTNGPGEDANRDLQNVDNFVAPKKLRKNNSKKNSSNAKKSTKKNLKRPLSKRENDHNNLDTEGNKKKKLNPKSNAVTVRKQPSRHVKRKRTEEEKNWTNDEDWVTV